MYFSTHEEVHNERRQQKTRAYFAKEIRQLNQLGFTEEIYTQEKMFPLSLIVAFPLVFLAYMLGTMTRVGGFLQAISPGVSLLDGQSYICANPSKIYGIYYCTRFDDGSLLITSSQKGAIPEDPAKQFFSQVYQTEEPATCLECHREGVNKLAQQGRNVVAPLNVGDVIWIAYRLNWIMLGGTSYDDEKSKKKNKDQ
jgi:hypothetical protein